MDRWALRLRAGLDAYAPFVAVALLVLGAVGGYITYTTHVDAGTRTATRQVAAWESTGDFRHRATVVEATDAFPSGYVLRNRTTYFTRVSPRLEGAFTYAYSATESGDLTVDVDVRLVLRSVSETGGATAAPGDESTTVYWSVDRRLNRTRVESLAPGERVSVPFSTNVTAAAERGTRIEEQLGATPGEVRVAVVARIDLSGVRNGRSVDRTRIYRLPIGFGPGVYRVEDPGTVTASGEQTARVQVPVTHSWPRRVGGPLLLVGSLLCLLGFLGARRAGLVALSDVERRSLAYRREREEFDDWITTGRVQEEAVGERSVAVDSLKGLVDVAIDGNRRVIEDAARDRYFVFEDELTYVYVPPAKSGESPTDGENPVDADGRARFDCAVDDGALGLFADSDERAHDSDG